MGGMGSGRWGSCRKADTVDDCLTLDVAKLTRDRLLRPMYRGTLHWTKVATGEEVSAVGYSTGPADQDEMIFNLDYQIVRSGEQIKLPIRLQTTYPHLGGVRWWFTCPLVVYDRACQRRVGKLYLPPGSKYFGCRHCYELTYESCQESHKFDRFDRHLAERMGTDFATLRRMMAGLTRRGREG